MSKQRFWPITISGALAVFLAGAFALLAVALALKNFGDGEWAVFAVLVWLLLHHAASTARTSMMHGTFTRSWWGIRTSTSVVETVVSEPAQPSKTETLQ